MKRILITGVTGFVGGYAAAAFLSRFADVGQVYGLGRSAKPANLPTGVQYALAQLSNNQETEDLLSRINPTDIIHLAAQSSVIEGTKNPISSWKSNVSDLISFSESVYKAASDANFYFVSSSEVYGKTFISGNPVSELELVAPISTYGQTKSIGEQFLVDTMNQRNGALVILRPFNHIGPGQDERFAIASFANQIARIEANLAPPIIEVGNLSAKRDFIDVRDVVDAYADVIQAVDMLKQKRCYTYNVCSGEARSIESLLLELLAQSSVSIDIKIVAERLRPSEIPTAVGKASLINHEIGWRPKKLLRETLSNTLDYARRKTRDMQKFAN